MREMPRANPNEASVMTGWSTSPPIALEQGLAKLDRGQVGGVEHGVGERAQRGGQPAFARDPVLGRALEAAD